MNGGRALEILRMPGWCPSMELKQIRKCPPLKKKKGNNSEEVDEIAINQSTFLTMVHVSWIAIPQPWFTMNFNSVNHGSPLWKLNSLTYVYNFRDPCPKASFTIVEFNFSKIGSPSKESIYQPWFTITVSIPQPW